MHEVLKELSLIGIVPVVVINDAKDAAPLAKALIEGGLPCAEVTFRTDAAEEAIKIISKEFPQMLVGAGTVLTPEQADRAMAAGAKFLVSPGLNPTVVKHCLAKGYPMAPGTANPSDVETAIELGLDVVKFFPAENAGGVNMIKAMGAAYTKMKFMPTGGINAGNINNYLTCDKILCCGGSWMVKGDLISAGKFDEIRAMTEQAVRTMLGFELGHIGINNENEQQAHEQANRLQQLFGFAPDERKIGIFADTYVELMKIPFYGTKGHIAIKTFSVDRAVHYLKRKGVEFNEESFAYDDKGNLTLAYLKEEIGGFAIHLTKK